jgi:hypothetical protein
MGKKVTYNLLGKRHGGDRPRRRWKDIIRIDVRETGCGDLDVIELAQYRVYCWLNFVMRCKLIFVLNRPYCKKKKKSKIVSVLNYAPRHKDVQGRG